MLCEIDRESGKVNILEDPLKETQLVLQRTFSNQKRENSFHLLWFEAKTLILLLPSLRCKEMSDRHSSGDSSHVIISFVMIITIILVIYTLLHTALIKKIARSLTAKAL